MRPEQMQTEVNHVKRKRTPCRLALVLTWLPPRERGFPGDWNMPEQHLISIFHIRKITQKHAERYRIIHTNSIKRSMTVNISSLSSAWAWSRMLTRWGQSNIWQHGVTVMSKRLWVRIPATDTDTVIEPSKQVGGKIIVSRFSGMFHKRLQLSVSPVCQITILASEKILNVGKCV